ncbi:complex III assembly factor LYRM7-like [Amphibalanus amphitrite]|nr:complex III assembly factor LYRM7-like isoform X2 [Amphibalanus amphitrite]XP_043190782.1 complex III assembly factor LYRM7-like isoform X2 [Amphibalanus amphitrite]XP_043190784.1 complex III assembly factor LYRM7-like isoform X2 [Amphibalanus amphitrite]XP_043190785.1 complex III assembly factor LYRM7-like isoform X2 [Amphibalanus amphitrite]XP_043212412.1 complex III assembly factor LYRM7-like [Amphibalanus amphitrite]XP_043212413.1 complex III assembly factor LYRM7-like [Amphibalanus amp
MSGALRKEVLSAFKRIHRARAEVFAGDDAALSAARIKINEEYKKNRGVTNEDSIKELVNFSKECETVLLKTVMQAKETEPGRYALRINKETYMWDNVPYRDVDLPPARPGGCSDRAS